MPGPGLDGPATVVGTLISGFDVPTNLRETSTDCERTYSLRNSFI